MRVVSVVGARPQFIKCSPVSTELRKIATEVLVHTGQHYDENMSERFFRDLDLPEADYNLAVGSGCHGAQTGEMLKLIEQVLLDENPDYVIVYGDTNSTLAGALAAAKLHIPIAHIEAGLRSFNRKMPEEINRILTDHVASLLFCPTKTAVENLAREGITKHVHNVGDVMYDAVLRFAGIARERSVILDTLALKQKEYLLATIHRPDNTDSESNLRNILAALKSMGERIIFPVHPRTKKYLTQYGLDTALFSNGNLQLVDPVGYLDMLMLEQNARLIVTDSGGIQKEAYFFGVPCVTLRSETEWVETAKTGWNVVVGTDCAAIRRAVNEKCWPEGISPSLFGDGHAARRIVAELTQSSDLSDAG